MATNSAKTIQKYLPFILMIPASNALWAWGVLPEIGEQGTASETIEWLVAQAVVPLLLTALLATGSRVARPILCLYGGMLALYGVGTLGWALMGIYTPALVYVVSVLFLISGFGLAFNALKDLNIGKAVKRYHLED